MPEIKIVRDSKPNDRDFRVLINGEHRATFRSRKRYRMIGYDLEAPDGKSIYSKQTHIGRNYFKPEFAESIRTLLPDIPTRAQIDRSLLIEHAHKENRERNEAIGRHRAQVRREILSVAVARYLDSPASQEHADMAAAILRQFSGEYYVI
jgi:hypothetical protein